MPLPSRKSPLVSVYLSQRRRGVPKPLAKERAKKVVALMKQKERGWNSSEAHQILKNKQEIARIRRRLLELDPKYKISALEVATIIQNFEFFEFEKLRNYDLFDFARDYAKLKLKKGRRPTQSDLTRLFKKAVREALRVEKDKGKRKYLREMHAEADSGLLRRVAPGELNSMLSFFERIEKENGLGKRKNQEMGLSIEFVGLLNVFGTNDLYRIVKEGLRDLRSEISKEEWYRAGEKIPGWSKKPPAVQERVVRERRVQALGNRIANEIIESEKVAGDVDGQSAALLELYHSNPGFRKVPKDALAARWVIYCLTTSPHARRNRQFLVQKAMEWFPEKRK